MKSKLHKRSYNKKWVKEHPEKIKLYSSKRRNEYKNAIFELLGRVCVKCGFDDVRALQVDHIFGGGSKERKSNKSNSTFYLLKMVVKDKNRTKYQLLCANCNWIKRHENNENRK